MEEKYKEEVLNRYGSTKEYQEYSEKKINGDELKKINEDTFYYYELLNMEVYYGGNKIGIISEVNDNGAQDLIRIKGENVNVLVPFVDEFIESIDSANKKICLRNLEGLL